MPQTTPTRSTHRSVRGQSVWGSLRPHVPRGSSPGPRTEQPDHLTQQPPTKQQRNKYIIWQSTNVSGDFSLISIYIRLRCCAFVPCRGALPWCLPCCEGSQPPSSATQTVLTHDMVCRVWSLICVNEFESNLPLPPFWGHTRDSHVTPARHLPSFHVCGPAPPV